MVAKTIPVGAFDLVIFGVTGDLSRRKILPALFRRFIAGQFDKDVGIIGAARKELSDTELRDLVQKAITEFVSADEYTDQQLADFCDTLSYQKVDLQADHGWSELAEKLSSSSHSIRVFYLSISPTLIASCTKNLDKHHLITPDTRLVVEKPLGTDLASAQELNDILRQAFTEKQIYRIDHYLGKETVQNLMALRFSNVLLEPVWNNQFIDHVQITVAETGDVDGRGEYYDQAGAIRDMVQNHLMQLLCLIAMEPPSQFDADDIRTEKLKVIKSLAKVKAGNSVRGQYQNAETSFLDHVNNPQSHTESYVAIKTEISNWRWAGVPFYLRTGKCLSHKVTEIVIVFKKQPHSIFKGMNANFQNKLTIRLQPREGITMHISVKEPGLGGMRLMNAPLDMSFAQITGNIEPVDAYERLIMDTIRGNQTLFMRADELEAAWQWVDDIILSWKKDGSAPLPYISGSSGPDRAINLIAKDKRDWENLSL